MFELEKAMKQSRLDEFKCLSAYQNSFFKSFCSFTDAKRNVKAIAALPIINLALGLHQALNSLFYAALGVANIAIGAVTFDLNELNQGCQNVKSGINFLLGALYHAASIVIDTLTTLLRLVTHSVATVALGIGKIGETILEGFTP
ncbi:hypothetical protein [Legionella sp. km772]|uniref:hypothetical protein n=1 Tax=Legionella sp. km772 TaxID=2498111 RepID=UPI000F8F81EF|nr:hypothetical protein [Legionella sp. km772]RUR07228.1 hypothetical protein ELY15_12390 [Legionella sp. km772]